MTDSIAISDLGSQYAQIIARSVREAQIYCELFPWDAPAEKILSIQPKGFILSGGPKSVYEENAPYIQKFILASGLPILGNSYGMQALTHALGGKVDPSANREYGSAEIQSLITNPLLSNLSKGWMSHGDKVTQLPDGFVALAKSGNSPYAAMGDMQRKYFGVQFHPGPFFQSLEKFHDTILPKRWTQNHSLLLKISSFRNEIHVNHACSCLLKEMLRNERTPHASRSSRVF